MQTGQRCKRGHVLAATGYCHAYGTLISGTGEATGWVNVCHQTGEDDDHWP